MCLWYLWYSSREDSLVSRHTKWNHMLQSLTTKSVDVEKAEIVAVLKPETCRYEMRRHPRAVNLRHMSSGIWSVCRMFFWVFFCRDIPKNHLFSQQEDIQGTSPVSKYCWTVVFTCQQKQTTWNKSSLRRTSLHAKNDILPLHYGTLCRVRQSNVEMLEI